MFARVLGAFLIVRAVTPLLVILVLAVAGSMILADVWDVLEEPVGLINDGIEAMQATVAAVQDDFAVVVAEIQDVVDLLGQFQLPNLNVTLPTSLDIPAFSIPVPDVSVSWRTASIRYPSGLGFSWSSGLSITWSNFSIRYPSNISVGISNLSIDPPNISLPGLSQLGGAIRSAFSAVSGVFNVFDSAFASLGQLTESVQILPQQISAIVQAAQQGFENVRAVAVRWSGILAVVTIIILVLVIIYFAVPMLDDLRRGWRLLTGQTTDLMAPSP